MGYDLKMNHEHHGEENVYHNLLVDEERRGEKERDRLRREKRR